MLKILRTKKQEMTISCADVEMENAALLTCKQLLRTKQ